MKIKIKFNGGIITVTFKNEEFESGTNLESIFNHINAEAATNIAANEFSCNIKPITQKVTSEVTFQIISNSPLAFEDDADPKVKADAKAKLIGYFKTLIHDFKRYNVLTQQQCEEINNHISVDFANDLLPVINPDDYIVTIDASGNAKVYFIRDKMAALIHETQQPGLTREKLSFAVSGDLGIKTLIDAHHNLTLQESKQELNPEFIPVRVQLTAIRKMLTEIKKFLHSKVNGYHDDAYNLLDQIGPKDCSGLTDFTPLTETVPVNTTMSPRVESINNATGNDKLRMLEAILPVEQPYKSDQEIRSAFNAGIELVKLYDKLYSKSESALLKKNDDIPSIKCPIKQFKIQQDFERVQEWANDLLSKGRLSQLVKKDIDEVKAIRERHSNRPLGKRPDPYSTPVRATSTHPSAKALDAPAEEDDSLAKKNKQTFSQRHPWVTRYAKIGAAVFGVLAVVSFFVPIPGLNFTLAAFFTKLSIACGTAAAAATIVAIPVGTVAAGGGLGAAGGAMAEKLKACMPSTVSNNAKMQKQLGGNIGSVSKTVEPVTPTKTDITRYNSVSSVPEVKADGVIADTPVGTPAVIKALGGGF